MADETRERAADECARVARGGDVGIVEHAVAIAAQEGVVARLRLGQHRNQPLALLRRQLPGSRHPEPIECSTHRLDVDRIRHHGVIYGQWTRPARRHSHDNDLVPQKLDPRRAAGAARPKLPPCCDVGIAELAALHFSQRDRSAKRARGAGEAHRFERVAGRYRCSAA